MNALTITGNLTDDPTKTVLANGTVIANFRIGNSERVGGEDRSNGFHDITVFNDQALNVLDRLKKGSRVVVSGRLQHRTFEREDGSRGGRVGIIANAVGESLEFRPKAELATTEPAPAPEEAPVPDVSELVEANA